MGNSDDLLKANQAYSEQFYKGDLTAPPKRKTAIVACMDARLDIYRMLGLSEGDAHVIRNAGGVVTDDVIRSLAISQRLLGSEEIVLIHHTDCGMCTFRDDDIKDQIEQETGIRPSFSLEAFREPAEDVRQSARRIRANPFVQKDSAIRGFVYDVTTGRLDEVALD